MIKRKLPSTFTVEPTNGQRGFGVFWSRSGLSSPLLFQIFAFNKKIVWVPVNYAWILEREYVESMIEQGRPGYKDYAQRWWPDLLCAA